jgi:3-keto-5-aminohexanoate cleavage enzyme
MEVFDLGMINFTKYLIHKDLINPPYYFNPILKNIACVQANILSPGLMMKELPNGSILSVGGVGNSQLKMNTISLIVGVGVNVGLEDNICATI